MENSKKTAFLPLLLVASVCVGLFIGWKYTPKDFAKTGNSYNNSKYQKMQDIIKIIDNYYVDSVNSDAVFEKAIGDMLHKLDPHSVYISAKDLTAANEQIQGEFAGIGVRFFIIQDTVCITHVIENSPSERAGLKDGDKIIGVDNKELKPEDVSNDLVMDKLKGPAGTKVKVSVLRNGKKRTATITRGRIPISSINTFFMLNDRTGFIKIDQFSMTTVAEFHQAAQELRSAGMEKLVLDLRNNGGGVLSAATKIADEFLKDKKTIVSTKGTHSPERTYEATTVGALEDTPLVILINENSASASEILAGAIQDNDRGEVVGRRSFGKGLVQEDMRLKDGSNLRLTIARYYTPTGRCIQKAYTEDVEEYYHDQKERYDRGELYKIDSSLYVDSLQYVTPKGDTVYGGGGIMPDVFVALDTSGISWYLTQLRYTPAFQAYAFNFVEGKRNKWQSPEVFSESFRVSDAVLNDFIEFANETYGLRYDEKQFQLSKSLIKKLLKAEFARQIWIEPGYYKVIIDEDREVQKALEVLQNK